MSFSLNSLRPFASRTVIAYAKNATFSSHRSLAIRAVSTWASASPLAQKWHTGTLTVGTGVGAVMGLTSGSRAFSSADATEEPAVVKTGDQVTARIRVQLPETGEVIVETKEGESSTFVVGVGQLIPGLETKMIGLKVGDEWSGSLAPEEAFGFHMPELIHVIPRDPSLEADSQLEVGQHIQLSNQKIGRITEVGEKEFTVDTNHPFAGSTLDFFVAIEAVEPEPVNAWSGVRVETLAPGDGSTYPKQGDQVSVSYKGTLADTGKVFDASKQPLQFTLGAGQVIQGWDIGIAKLSVGESANLYIPSEFAYGASGAGGVIPPNANLIFEVKLEGIEPK